MRDLWDELDVLVPAPLCGCAEAKPYIEHFIQQRLLIFLMGLNESYSHIRSDLLLKTTVPSVNQAYATAVQEESQRLLSVVEIHKEPLTMLANRKPGFRGKKLLDNPCVHCGYRNHLSKDCYRIIGYPTDFKSKRKADASSSSRSTGGFQQDSTGFKSSANYAASAGQGHALTLTEEEYNHVQNLRHNSGGDGDLKANFTGNVSLTPNVCEHEWIIDSGATHHVTSCKDMLSHSRCLGNQGSNTVQLPTGNRAPIAGICCSTILGDHTLKDILLVPDFKFNLLSVDQRSSV